MVSSAFILETSLMIKENRQEINTIRSQINEIDSTILSLLHKRLVYAKEIGQLKKAEKCAIEDGRREDEIYQRLLIENRDLFPKEALIAIFKKIIATCKDSQQ